MSADKPDIQAIFDQAIALEPGEKRFQHLNQACGDDLQVRARVEALLHAHSEAGGFFGGKLPATTATERRRGQVQRPGMREATDGD